MANEGFVVSDRTRHIVFAAVVAGEADLDGIAKRHRVLGRAAARAATELAEAGLLAKAAGGWQVTEAGRETAEALKKAQRKGGLLNL